MAHRIVGSLLISCAEASPGKNYLVTALSLPSQVTWHRWQGPPSAAMTMACAQQRFPPCQLCCYCRRWRVLQREAQVGVLLSYLVHACKGFF